MGVVQNYVDESERIFLTSASLDSVSSLWTSNGSLSSDAVVYQDPDFGSLKLTPSNLSSYAKFNCWSNPSTATPSQYCVSSVLDVDGWFEGFVWVKPTVNCTIYLKAVLTKAIWNASTQLYTLSTDSADVITGSEGTVSVDLGTFDESKWHLVRCVPVSVPSTGNYSISLQLRIEFSTLTNAVANISRPTILSTYQFFNNAFMQDVGNYMPAVFPESDTADFRTNKPTFPMMRFVDVITTDANELNGVYQDFVYLDKSEGYDPNDPTTWSKLVNPEICDGNTLAWLAQFRGRQLLITYQPSTEGVAWTNFYLDESTLDGVGVLGSDAGGSTGLAAGVDAYARWQVRTGYYGHNAGTITAMTAAIQRGLTGSGTVTYTQGSNQINFFTAQSETFGTVSGDIGTSVASILSLIEPARPLGMLVTHTLT